MPEIGKISKPVSGADVVEWKIDGFFSLSEGDAALYFSPPFLFGGKRWLLEVYTRGRPPRNRSDSSGYVDLVVVKCGSNTSCKHTFSVSLKTVTGRKYNEEHCTKIFQGYDFHYFNRFISRLELSTNRHELVPNGVLTVLCTLKSTIRVSKSKSLFNKLSQKLTRSLLLSAHCYFYFLIKKSIY